jgi:hypothetical protein
MKLRILLLIPGFLFFNLAFGQTGEIPGSGLNKELIAILDTIHQEDQKFRQESLILETKFGWDSKEVQDLWEIINIKDSLNLIKVEKILTEYGWLGSDIIGEKGNKTLFLVIQHADTQTQLKYFPMLREAVKNGKANAGYLALMEDRVLLAQGEKQIYGSQLEMDYKTNLYIISPMIDPDNVDQRRAEVGLKPLAEYLKLWELIWDPEAFKRRMEEYDAEKKTN